MTPGRTPSTFRLDDELLEAMQTIKDRDGIALTDQVTMALEVWLERLGVHVIRKGGETMQRRLLERLTGTGKLLEPGSAKVIVAKADYGLNIWQEVHQVRTFGGASTVEGLKDIQGQIRITGGIAKLVGQSLVLELADGQHFPFFFTDSEGTIAAQGAIVPPSQS
jgi:hypothetical protein